jgi:hypothetical protein
VAVPIATYDTSSCGMSHAPNACSTDSLQGIREGEGEACRVLPLCEGRHEGPGGVPNALGQRDEDVDHADTEAWRQSLLGRVALRTNFQQRSRT